MGKVLTLGIKLDSRPLVDPAKQAEASLRGIGDAAIGAEGKLGKTATAAGIAGRALAAMGAALSIRQVTQWADEMTNLEGRLRLVTHGSSELHAIQSALLAISNETRTSYGGTADLYARLARSTKDLHATQSDLLAVTKAINQGFIVSGASAQESSAALIQLGQAFASGALRGDELRSVLEQAPRLAEAIANGLGVTVGKLRELGAEGKLTSKQVFDAIRSQAKPIEQEFAQMPKTIAQSITLAVNTLQQQVAGLNKVTGAGEAAGATIEFVAENAIALAAIMGAPFAARAVQQLGAYVERLVEAKKAQVAMAIATAEANAVEATQARFALAGAQAQLRANVALGASAEVLAASEQRVALANARVALTAEAAAASTTALTTAGAASTVAMGTASTAAKALWTAMGGWVGVGLTALIATWAVITHGINDAREAQEKFNAAQAKALEGIALPQLAAQYKIINEQINELEAKLKSLPAPLAQSAGMSGAADPNAGVRNGLADDLRALRAQKDVLTPFLDAAIKAKGAVAELTSTTSDWTDAQAKALVAATAAAREQELLNAAYGRGALELETLRINEKARQEVEEHALITDGKLRKAMDDATEAMRLASIEGARLADVDRQRNAFREAEAASIRRQVEAIQTVVQAKKSEFDRTVDLGKAALLAVQKTLDDIAAIDQQTAALARLNAAHDQGADAQRVAMNQNEIDAATRKKSPAEIDAITAALKRLHDEQAVAIKKSEADEFARNMERALLRMWDTVRERGLQTFADVFAGATAGAASLAGSQFGAGPAAAVGGIGQIIGGFLTGFSAETAKAAELVADLNDRFLKLILTIEDSRTRNALSGFGRERFDIDATRRRDSDAEISAWEKAHGWQLRPEVTAGTPDQDIAALRDLQSRVGPNDKRAIQELIDVLTALGDRAEEDTRLLNEQRHAREAALVEDLAVMTLRAQGHTQEADALALQIDYQRRVQAATDAGFGPEALAAIDTWRIAMEGAAQAAEKRSLDNLQLEILRLQLDESGARDLQRQIRLADASSDAQKGLLELIFTLEDTARAAAVAAAEQAQLLAISQGIEDLEVRNLRASGKDQDADFLSFQHAQDRELANAIRSAQGADSLGGTAVTAEEQAFIDHLRDTLQSELARWITDHAPAGSAPLGATSAGEFTAAAGRSTVNGTSIATASVVQTDRLIAEATTSRIRLGRLVQQVERSNQILEAILNGGVVLERNLGADAAWQDHNSGNPVIS